MPKGSTGIWILALALVAGCDEAAPEVIDAEEPGEGVAFDEQNPYADVEGKADSPRTYEVPTDLPQLERPEVIVSLEQKTVHLFDRATGFSAVYPTGPGALTSSGRSMTPTGFYATWSDTDEGWYFIPRRYTPDYFGGFPFLRLTIENSMGYHTYGFHGPISYTCPGGGTDCDLVDRQWFLRREFVSHGCMRMEAEDIVELFWSIEDLPSVPVAIIAGVEVDAAGSPVDVGSDVTLWGEGDAIDYGSCGEQPDPYTVDGRWDAAHRGC